MLELLAKFSIQQIIVYGIMLTFAIKGIIDLVVYFKELYNKKFNKDYNTKKQTEILEEHYAHCIEQHQESVKMYELLENKIDNWTQSVDGKFNKIEDQLGLLMQSDMHDIKGWIVEKHHTLMKQGWVDDFTMDTLEKRYSDYKAEGGNSYVETLINELRKLPQYPPEKIKNS